KRDWSSDVCSSDLFGQSHGLCPAEAVLANRPTARDPGAHRGIARGIGFYHWFSHHWCARGCTESGHAHDRRFPTGNRRRSCRRGHRHSAFSVGDWRGVINHRQAAYSLDAPGETHQGGERMNLVAQAWHWLTDPAHWTGIAGIPNRLAEHVTVTF